MGACRLAASSSDILEAGTPDSPAYRGAPDDPGNGHGRGVHCGRSSACCSLGTVVFRAVVSQQTGCGYSIGKHVDGTIESGDQLAGAAAFRSDIRTELHAAAILGPY